MNLPAKSPFMQAKEGAKSRLSLDRRRDRGGCAADPRGSGPPTPMRLTSSIVRRSRAFAAAGAELSPIGRVERPDRA
jgi:hypothetical protein